MRFLCWRAKADLVLFAVGLWVLDLGTGTPSTDRVSASPSARSTEEHFVHRHQGKLKTTKTHTFWKNENLRRAPSTFSFPPPLFLKSFAWRSMINTISLASKGATLTEPGGKCPKAKTVANE